MATALKGWGLDREGLDPYGSAVAGVSISLVAAVAISTHEVQVTLSGVPLHSNPNITGDALNPLTWQIQRLDTLVFLNVVAVRAVSPTIYVLTTIEAFGPATTTHEVSTSNLLDDTGAPAATRVVDFAGIIDINLASPDAIAAKRGVALVDIANPQTTSQVSSLAGGTLRISAGDYQNETGDELLRKLIIRRLITKPGDFFHLPDYGIGIRNKEPLPVSELVKLKASVESQILREPEVESVTAALVLSANGTLLVTVAARSRNNGQKLNVSVPISQPGGLTP